MNVVYSGTRNLYPALRGAIRSLIEYNRDVKIYVFAEDDELPYKIPVDHEIINMSGQTYFGPDCPNRHNQFTYMAMIRCATAEILSDVDKVIQLDVDTIICDSLQPLWETDLTGKWIGWCQEHFGGYKPYGEKYYNFGVAVMNLKQMREDGLPQKCVKEMNENVYRFIDQDIMNYFAVPDMTVDIPMRFNESFCCGFSPNPAVIHYAGYPDWYESTTVPRGQWKDMWKAVKL